MNLNKISAEVPQETEAQVVKHIKDALTQLPFLIQLSKLERIRMAKFSRKNLAFVERGLMYAQANPSFVPAFVNVGEFLKDVELVRCLRRVYAEAESFCEKLKDTLLVAEADSYRTARMFYQAVKTTAKEGAEGADTIVKDLAYHYKRQGAGKGEEEKKETPA